MLEPSIDAALLLARAQFAFTVSFHFLFPAFSIGLASFLMVLEALWLKTGRGVYANLYRYWLKIFAIVFGMGVVSGLVMSYQFGTNWSVFAHRTGPILGPLMAYEVMTAFFLEAGFLGVMLFGISKVGRGLHFFATCMVALGTAISATWILSVNSWMQTPTGFAINAQGQFVPAGSWWTIIWNPSFPYRLVHTVIAAYLTTALVVAAVGAWHLLRDRENLGARKMLSMGLGLLAVMAPVQILAGDAHGLDTLEHQPAKILAMEGHFDAHPDGAPLVLFGLPSDRDETVHAAVTVPLVSSLILTHHLHGALPGLKNFPKADRPPVAILFWSFRVMVGLGMAMLGLALWGLWARIRGRLYDQPWLHRAALAMGPAGFVAVLAGWITTEVGRQPWVVYGQLRTAQAASPLAAPELALSLAAFAVVYFCVFGMGTYYVLRLMAQAPQAHEREPRRTPRHAAGITPAAAFEPAKQEERP